MQKQTLQGQLKEINNSTLHNMRFLLESYSNEVLEAIDKQSSVQSSNQEEVFQSIRRDVSSVINMLRGIETVINHNTYIHTKVAS
jgi:predicted component of type VI protein secretion system